MSSSQRARQRGITLVEMIIFIVIIGIAVAGVLGVMTMTTKNSADPLRRKQALMIAEALLEEVELAGFTYCDPASNNANSATSVAACDVPEAWGPEPTGNQRPFDNVNDYAGSATPFNNGAGQLSDVNLRALGVQGYTATLSIVPENLNDIAGGNTADPSVLRITVVVNYDGANFVRLDGYRTRFAPKIE